MKSWQVNELDTQPQKPEIISSSDESRAIVLHLESGERLPNHVVHERVWVVVVAGELEIENAAGQRASGGPGLLVEFEPRERHEVLARSDARFVLLLTPWPGDGHPGALTLEEKADVRDRAAEQAPSSARSD